MPFSSLPTPLAEALTTRGYEALTEVQTAVGAADADGRDLIVSAQTGSGKTVAFGLAMAHDLLDSDGRAGPAGAPAALIIAPTRELALQVQRELAWLYAKTGARVVACVGGMNVRVEQRALAHGSHIVVGTPGRLRDHLERGALDPSALKVVVLDEADEMLDLGFREDLEEILDATPETRRTLLFSATMPKPIVALARTYQRDALRISTVSADRGHGDISYQAVAVAPADIEHAVVNLLRYHDAGGAIIFCATRENVRHLHASLVERGFAAVALSGEHSQSERNHALQALRDRRAQVCVATDVAARGIDLPDLRLVIHAELPRDAETLQHRSGRTGRAGKKGTAVLIVPYPRRRRVDAMLRGARIAAEWIAPPTPEAIRAQDDERLFNQLTQPIETDESSESDRALALRLLEAQGAEALAAALVRAYRARLPEPEDLIDAAPASPRAQRDDAMASPRGDFGDSPWFLMNIGRRHRADPRWLLPLLCRRGHITKGDIGAIRIADSETAFQVSAGVAKRFLDAVRRTATNDPDSDGAILIIPHDGQPNSPGTGRAQTRPHHGSARGHGGPGGPHGAGRGGPRAPYRPGGKAPGAGAGSKYTHGKPKKRPAKD